MGNWVYRRPFQWQENRRPFAGWRTAPGVVLNLPANGATAVSTTAVLDFTGTDPQGGSIEYEMQLDTVNTFDSQNIGYTISNLSYDSKSKDVSVQLNSSVADVHFKSDGTRMYVVNAANANIWQYDLSTAWDVSTASYLSNLSFGVDLVNPRSVVFSADGTKFFVMDTTVAGGNFPRSIVQYTMSTAWDVTTATETAFWALSLLDTAPFHVRIHPSGTCIFFSGNTAHKIYRHNLSTPWDLSTVSGTPHSLFDWTTQLGSVSASSYAFSTDGLKLIISYSSSGTATFYQYHLTTAFDLSTVVYDSITKDLSNNPDSDPRGFFFRSTGLKMYVAGNHDVKVYQYSLGSLGPLLDKYSDVPDAGFANPDTVGDTHPFNNTENIQYTMQSALSGSTTYYWRVRGYSPSSTGGSGAYGDWTSPFSFTTAAGGGGTTFTQSLNATLSFAGGVVKRTSTARTATLSFSGAQAKLTGKGLSGALSFVGAIAKRTSKGVSGALNFVGAQTRRTGKALSGALSFVGAQSRSIGKSLSAALTFSGATTKRTTSGGFTATLNFSGATTKRTNKSATGTLSFSGAPLGTLFGKVFAGTLSFSGSMSKRTNAFKTATLNFVGNTTKRTTQSYTATLNFVGDTKKRTAKAFTAALAFVGAFARQPLKSFTATLGFSGAINKRTNKSLTANLSFSGGFVKQIRKALAAALSFAGDLITSTGVFLMSFTATLQFSGSMRKSVSKRMQATLSFAGVITKFTKRTFNAVLAFIGTFTKSIANIPGQGIATVTLSASEADVVYTDSPATCVISNSEASVEIF